LRTSFRNRRIAGKNIPYILNGGFMAIVSAAETFDIQDSAGSGLRFFNRSQLRDSSGFTPDSLSEPTIWLVYNQY